MQTRVRKHTNAHRERGDLAFAGASEPVDGTGAGRMMRAVLPHKFNVSSIFSTHKLIFSPSSDMNMSFNFNSPIIKAEL